VLDSGWKGIYLELERFISGDSSTSERRAVMKEDLKKHGAFSWYELMTTDVGKAVAFYQKLFGWSTEEMAMEGMSYTVVKIGGEGVGGIMATPSEAKGMPPTWGVYVTVDDVDATVKMTGELGGKVLLPPRDIPGVGRFSVIQDPQGAVISVITYREA
jgi:predicted enzyme related to lactoylglutathione lyase